jgi:hypothetical protein
MKYIVLFAFLRALNGLRKGQRVISSHVGHYDPLIQFERLEL